MPRNEIDKDQAGKTAALIALANTVLAPLYWADAKLGFTAAIIATSAFLYTAHELGKKRRPAANIENNLNTFFGAGTGDRSTEVANTLSNIAAGGEAMFDEVFPKI